MKKVLVTGKNSYIGTSLINYLKDNDQIELSELDLIDESWKTFDFSRYDCVFHVAGLAHSTPDESMREIYYKVNTELAIETAKKAKAEGVKQFIFMSSIIVYGSGKVGKKRVIDWNTTLNPDNFYGDSKVQAEKGLTPLSDGNFHVAILRPPMIYGPGSKGNYPRLSNFAKKSIIFPKFKNQRSMLYIKNLCKFIELLIINNDEGIFMPQNEDYVCTSEMVRIIAGIHKHRIYFTKLANPLIHLFENKTIINKVFGSSTISKECSIYKEPYCIIEFKKSLEETES